MTIVLLIKLLGVIVMTSFIPLTAFSFYKFRLKKKEEEYIKVIDYLELKESKAFQTLPLLKDEYSATDYILPVLFATVVCLILSTILLLGRELKIAESPSLLLSGVYIGGTKDTLALRSQSLLGLSLGFLGGYIFSIHNLFRRLITIDLPHGTYYSIGIRLILASTVALIISYSIITSRWSEFMVGPMPVIAFLAGMFPERTLHYLRDRIKIFADKSIPKSDELPLEMIEGISIYQKIRLNEVGIDNAQNLATANPIELFIRTPFKVGLLLDWIGQAMLYVYLKSDIDKIRNTGGIRTISQFKNIGQIEGEISKIARITEIPEQKLNSIYQYIKDDPALKAFSRAESITKMI